MTNEKNFRKGDRVSLLATVESAVDGGYDIRVDGVTDRFGPADFVFPYRLTLVERPQRTVTIELDEDQVDYFWNGRLTYAPNAIIAKFADALEELNK